MKIRGDGGSDQDSGWQPRTSFGIQLRFAPIDLTQTG
jgi:hypothetical protein